MDLSIIIPAYNISDMIEECVLSIIEQIKDNIEIIIIDDDSKDDTLEKCNLLSEQYDCVKVYHKENNGVSAARNFGIEKASGNWIMFVDGDDGIQPRSMAYVDFNCKSDMMLFGYSKEYGIEQGNGKETIISTNLLQQLVLAFQLHKTKIKEVHFFDEMLNWSCWGRVFRRDIIIENNIRFPEGITHGEDLLFCYNYYKYSKDVTCIDRILYYYRIRSGSVSHKYNEKRVKNTLNMYEHLKKIDEDILENKEYYYFVLNRLLACCHKYYADKNNKNSICEKSKQLDVLCQIPECKKAIEECNYFMVSGGRKTRVKDAVISILLRIKLYRLAIYMS